MIITEPRGITELIKYNTFCRQNKVSFFYSLTCGVSTSIFVDHGEHHIINDPNGEKPVQKLITDVTIVSESVLLIRYDHPAGQLPEAISVGHFEITDVVGMAGSI